VAVPAAAAVPAAPKDAAVGAAPKRRIMRPSFMQNLDAKADAREKGEAEEGRLLSTRSTTPDLIEDVEVEQKEEEEDEDDEVLEPLPIVGAMVASAWRRLIRQPIKPGHVVARRWMRKGVDQGYISVPFASALRLVMPQCDVNVALIGRRERSDKVAKAWQKIFEDEVPAFDISGEADCPWDLDPVDPPWDTPLNQSLPSDMEMLAKLDSELPLRAACAERGEIAGRRWEKPAGIWAARKEKWKSAGRPSPGDAKILREVVAGLPAELLDEKHRDLVRATISQILSAAWALHSATDAKRVRWRFACTDGEKDDVEEDVSLARSYFLVAGTGLEFVPSQFVDSAKVSASRGLTPQQLMRMSSEDWAAIETVAGTNVSEALKRVPAGWTTIVKGKNWPGQKKGAVFRLPPGSKRLFIEIDVLEIYPAKPQTDEQSMSNIATPIMEDAEQKMNQKFSWAGPLAGALVGSYLFLKRAPPFKFGQEKRKELSSVVGSLPGVRRSKVFQLDSVEGAFEQKDWMDFASSDEAPVVLLIGAQTETGRLVARKLVTSGYHVVLLRPEPPDADGKVMARVERMLPQGAILASVPVRTGGEVVSDKHNLPVDIYNAVSGVDKVVICASDAMDEEGNEREELKGMFVQNVLSSWQLYRADFAEQQRAYSAKVRLFNFARGTDIELWSNMQWSYEDDRCFNYQRTFWFQRFTRTSSDGKSIFGQWKGVYPKSVEGDFQSELTSPTLKLNFSRFSGLVFSCFNCAVDNEYTFVLRTSEFEETRIQYEYTFKCKASRHHSIRMPFSAFRPANCAGPGLNEPGELAAFKLNRADVVQMAISKRRKSGDPLVEHPFFKWDQECADRITKIHGQDRLQLPREEELYGPRKWKGYWGLNVKWMSAYRSQTEPQVIILGKDEDIGGLEEDMEQDDADAALEEKAMEEEGFFFSDADVDSGFQEAELQATAELEELAAVAEAAEEAARKKRREDEAKRREALQEDGKGEEEDDIDYARYGRPRTALQAITDTGLSYTIIKVKGFNDHPGGKFPIRVEQAPITEPPMTCRYPNLGTLSRGDAAELVVSVLTQPSCVNAEMAAGECLREDGKFNQGRQRPKGKTFEIRNTLEEDVKKYMKQLVPNT